MFVLRLYYFQVEFLIYEDYCQRMNYLIWKVYKDNIFNLGYVGLDNI